ncbi:hypothetical protein [Fulvivirga imtechensis]|nr:hypothetical protein [Fulvivirga imtechensis]
MCMAFVLLHFAQKSFAQKGRGDRPSIPLDHFYAEPENRNALRVLLSKFHFSFSTGYGRTFYRQDLSDFAILQQQDSLPLIFGKDFNIAGGNISSGYNYWFNDLQSRNNINFDPSTDFIVSADSAALKFTAPGMSIPLNFSIHFEFDRYRVGGGFAFEYHRPGNFNPTVYEDRISGYEPNFGSTFFKKYYVMLGARVYRYYEYSLSVDANIGAINLTSKFNKSIIQKGVYLNLGATVERDLSEYFRVFVKPSFDIKSFTLNIPETDLTIPQSMNAFYLSFGITYRIPELPKCFLKQCTTQVNHQHGNMEYRSRMHPVYKKQNPHHGENYPRLIKYKGKNKKKLHAY